MTVSKLLIDWYHHGDTNTRECLNSNRMFNSILTGIYTQSVNYTHFRPKIPRVYGDDLILVNIFLSSETRFLFQNIRTECAIISSTPKWTIYLENKSAQCQLHYLLKPFLDFLVDTGHLQNISITKSVLKMRRKMWWLSLIFIPSCINNCFRIRTKANYWFYLFVTHIPDISTQKKNLYWLNLKSGPW